MAKLVMPRTVSPEDVLALLEERGPRGLTCREGGKALGCDGRLVSRALHALGDRVVSREWSPVKDDPSCLQEARYVLRTTDAQA